MEHFYTTTWLSIHQQPVTNYDVCTTAQVMCVIYYYYDLCVYVYYI